MHEIVHFPRDSHIYTGSLKYLNNLESGGEGGGGQSVLSLCSRGRNEDVV